MSYAHYQVACFSRTDRALLAVVASGLTMDAASRLAATLRQQNADDEAAVGFTVQTMALEDQAARLASGETMAALAEDGRPAPPPAPERAPLAPVRKTVPPQRPASTPTALHSSTYRINVAPEGHGPSPHVGTVARGLCASHATAIAAVLRQSNPGRTVTLCARGGGAGGTAEALHMGPEALSAERAVMALRERAATGEPAPTVEVQRDVCGPFRATLRLASGRVLDTAVVWRPAAPSPVRCTRFGATYEGDFSRRGAVGRAFDALLDVAEGCGFDRAAVAVCENGEPSAYYARLAGQPATAETVTAEPATVPPLRLVASPRLAA